ncbi:phosphatase PAP2 family protein [bacterium]|nr:phosphatase PAP2 family protein [bacterium]
MLDLIKTMDKTLFLTLNRSVANPVLDAVMPFITDVHNWIIPILLIWLYLMIFGGKKGRITGIGLIFLITLSDQLSSSVIKPFVHRFRPCHPDFFIEGGRFLIGMKKSMSFPSSHATNMGAMATYFSVKYPKTRWIVISIALIISYSRVYVGVHYVTDALAGLLLGILCGGFILKSETWIRRAWQHRKSNRSDQETSAKTPSKEKL